MIPNDDPRVRVARRLLESLRRKLDAEGRLEAPLPAEVEPASRTIDSASGDGSAEVLGLAPDLSRLPLEVRGHVRRGADRGGSFASVCVAMFRAGYHIDEVWMTVTDPANGISQEFFKEDGASAEILLELTIARAIEEAADE